MSEAYGVGAKQALAPLTEGHAAPLGARAKWVEPQAATGVAPPQVTLQQDELQHTGYPCSIVTARPCLSLWLARRADSMVEAIEPQAATCHALDAGDSAQMSSRQMPCVSTRACRSADRSWQSFCACLVLWRPA